MSNAADDFRRRMALVRAALKSSPPTGGGGAPGISSPAKPAGVEAGGADKVGSPDASGQAYLVAPAPEVKSSRVVIPPPRVGAGVKGPRTVSRKQMRAEQARDVRLNGERPPTPAIEDRPKTRGECEGGPRPCPMVGCRHHTALEVQPTGSITTNHPDKQVEELTASCSLDVADAGPLTLEQTGAVLNLTRERVRQIETAALAKVAAALEPPRFVGSCKARCAETGLKCQLPAHSDRVQHRNERGPFRLVAAEGQTVFVEKRRLEQQAERNPEGMALLEASHV